MLCTSYSRLQKIPKPNLNVYFFEKKFISDKKYKIKLKECYDLLNVKEDSDQETIRKSFLDLVKRYHPDSGSPDASSEKFNEIESAYRFINRKCSQDRWDVEESMRIKEFDIKHTAPQHRQYLSYEGVGYGSPSQREKQYSKRKASQAMQNVLEHRMEKALASEGALMDKSANKKQNHNIKTQYGFDRLVEDLIQEAMSKGEFNNLPGSGKPLPITTKSNPYVDFVTHKLNEVLIENGFTPEWITLQKEIRHEIEIFRTSLQVDRCRLGPCPLADDEVVIWNKIIEKHKNIVKNINNKITHYNLVVPILQKQMFLISLGSECDNVLKNSKNNTQVKITPVNKSHQTESNTNSETFLSFFSFIFK